MTAAIFFLMVAGLGFFLVAVYADDFFSMLGMVIAVACAVGAGLGWQSDAEKAAAKAAEQTQKAADAQPRKISEADGCSVYTFNPTGGRWMYFTKCVNAEVTTQNIYSVPNGKTTRTETMEIKTK